MGILKTNKLEVLRKNSLNAISVFQKTIDKLKFANEEIKKEDSRLSEEVHTLIENKEELAIIQKTNEKMINKIQDIIN